MVKKTYHGSCHCKKVTFSAEIDLEKGTGRCNCTLCTKSRNWSAIVKPSEFKLISGKESLSDYSKGQPYKWIPGAGVDVYMNHSFFCKTCGVRPFGAGNVPEIGGNYYSISLASLDDLDFKEAMESPMTFFNGRDNDWMKTPSYTKHM